MSEFTVGQKVIVEDGRGRVSEEEITRVGRTYVYTGVGWAEKKFNAATGIAPSDRGFASRLHTLEQWAEAEERKAILATFREHGLEFRLGRNDGTLTIEQLRAIAAVLKGDS